MDGAILLWLILSIIVGAIGSDRTIGFWLSFLASLILSPLIGFIIVLLSKSKTQQAIEAGLLNKLSEPKSKDIDEMHNKLEKLESMKDKKLVSESEYQFLRKEILKG